MNLLFDSFWRALAYCLRPRVMALTLLPLLLLVLAATALFYLLWEPAVDLMQRALADWALMENLLRWLERVGLERLRMVVAPLLVLMLALPLAIMLCLLVVSGLVTSAAARLVARRRFPALQARPHSSIWRSLGYGLLSALLALTAWLVTLPLWLIPPLAVVLPPLIWGWMTYRVMVFDVLADYASPSERAQLLARHRLGLLLIGLAVGYLGAAPGLVWVVGAMAVVLAPLLVPLAIWIYTAVFVFSSLWFAHFCLAALHAQRAAASPTSAPQTLPYDDAHAPTGPT